MSSQEAGSDRGLPRAWGEPVLQAVMRSVAEDFRVDEIDGFEATGSGEHELLTIEKRGLNTAEVARRLARWAGVPEMAVGYAGLKDRHAVTRQRFSVHLPGREAPSVDGLEGDGLRVIEQTRHVKKIPRGALVGNRFELTLREVEGERAAIGERLARAAAEGVPNWFGEQRFGRGGGNIDAALAMFAGRRMRRDQRGHLLSAARSELFNRVLAERVRAGNWNTPVEGEAWMLDSSRAAFGPEPWNEVLAERLAAFDIHPSAPLWGQGELRSESEARALEMTALDTPDAHAMREGLEAAGLRQERRATRLRPQDLTWEWPADDVLRLKFSLSRGTYATAVLKELGPVRDAAQAG